MKFDNKQDQIYDWLKSIHNMIVGIMLVVGFGAGILVWHFTGNWIFLPICFVGSFAFPLADNIRRRVLHHKGKLI